MIYKRAKKGPRGRSNPQGGTIQEGGTRNGTHWALITHNINAQKK
jgi:hypothetical protein